MDQELKPFPSPPWRLKGHALIQWQLIDVDRARVFLPPDLRPVAVMPGRTLGGLYYASYGAGSSLRYNELIVIPGLVRHRLRVGAWVSHIYVDDQRSVAGGRQIWSLPKEQAEFNHARDGTVTISQGDRLLCKLYNEKSVGQLLLPLFAPVISKGERGLHWFRGTGTAICGTGRGRVEIPSDSPLASLGLDYGRRLQLDRLNLLMHAPRSIVF